MIRCCSHFCYDINVFVSDVMKQIGFVSFPVVSFHNFLSCLSRSYIYVMLKLLETVYCIDVLSVYNAKL